MRRCRDSEALPAAARAAAEAGTRDQLPAVSGLRSEVYGLFRLRSATCGLTHRQQTD
jgi:hypothetical protein